MGTFLGATPEDLDALASAFAASATRLRGLGAQISQQLAGTTWSGADLDRFSAQWHDTLSPSLAGTGDRLDVAAAVLRAQARQQRTASGDAVLAGGWSMPTPHPGAPLPTAPVHRTHESWTDRLRHDAGNVGDVAEVVHDVTAAAALGAAAAAVAGLALPGPGWVETAGAGAFAETMLEVSKGAEVVALAGAAAEDPGSETTRDRAAGVVIDNLVPAPTAGLEGELAHATTDAFDAGKAVVGAITDGEIEAHDRSAD
jgi:uncharacterized protein YukE